MSTIENLLELKNLKTYFYIQEGIVKAVDGVSFRIRRGESMGLVGESGSGKSTIGFSIMKLVPRPGKIVGGKVYFDGEELLKKTEQEMQRIRGSKIAMTFQDPMTYLNPRIKIIDQIIEAILLNSKISKIEAREKAIKMIDSVKIPSPSERATDYPHQLSGGMRQRILIAIALSCNPKLFIADEPTTALDAIIQSEILDLIEELKTNLKLSLLLISHDLGIVSQICDTIGVIYAGNIIEFADKDTIYQMPKHPYSIGLIDSIPQLDSDRNKPLRTIKGIVPELINLPSGCVFQPRCPYSINKCKINKPELVELSSNHFIACHRAEEIF